MVLPVYKKHHESPEVPPRLRVRRNLSFSTIHTFVIHPAWPLPPQNLPHQSQSEFPLFSSLFLRAWKHVDADCTREVCQRYEPLSSPLEPHICSNACSGTNDIELNHPNPSNERRALHSAHPLLIRSLSITIHLPRRYNVSMFEHARILWLRENSLERHTYMPAPAQASVRTRHSSNRTSLLWLHIWLRRLYIIITSRERPTAATG
jgi:hypothetical protein